ncbi:D-cysteine desulfhydrase family protein [Burkholderia sp. AU30198]|uniref:D-cysteine desulfhydrase family protein n=1 Tax=Burkholderia sp. AU30198 TaxID=2879627 RepID=UPI001CF2743C|nr:D-cysteine desulfhydrase family protein [Burkholderia sp. AU30198]MCA8298018.1 D-cysteine desulfhydrase family protein [Burkholderia sp. AU30198]
MTFNAPTSFTRHARANLQELFGFDSIRVPRYPLLDGATPIHPLPRLSAYLGGATIHVKREDIAGVGGGGNKLRKLELLIGEALQSGAETVITVGARQSNHARLTAAAAARAGMRCEVVLTRSVPRDDADYVESGNILLDSLFNARVHDLPASADAMAYAIARADELRASGQRVYICPFGGSSPVGCLAYAACAAEIVQQSRAQGNHFDRIIVPNGSGGTHAGLVAGLAALGTGTIEVDAYTVYAPAAEAHRATLDKAQQTARIINRDTEISPDAVRVDASQLGPGYGIPTDAMRRAVRLLASQEGLLLDPVYSGKAFAGLIEGVTSGRYASDKNILFVMTGGLPGLFAYRHEFQAA